MITIYLMKTGQHSEKIYNADLLVLSPGIKKELPVVQEFYKRNIPVISEIEMAYRFSNNKMCCYNWVEW